MKVEKLLSVGLNLDHSWIIRLFEDPQPFGSVIINRRVCQSELLCLLYDSNIVLLLRIMTLHTKFHSLSLQTE